MALSLGNAEELVDSEFTASSSSFETTASASVKSPNKKPTCVIVLGMAGSGKTTFVQVL